MNKNTLRRSLMAMAIAMPLSVATVQAAPMLTFEQEWTQSGAGAEIVAIDTASGRVFNTYSGGVEVRNISDGSLIGTFTVPNTGEVNSVAVNNGIVAVALAASTETDDGAVAFFNAADTDPDNAPPLNTVGAGALPDMLTFTPDGSKVVVANEGEPNQDYTIDPEGTVTVIDISGGVASAAATHIDFNAFDSNTYTLEDDGLRIFGPGASVSEDLEPEYITVSSDSSTAFVTLQENNAVAKIDLATNTVTALHGLGTKDHSQSGNAFDASNEDGPGDDPLDGNLQNWPVFGMYQPDSIVSYELGGQTYYVTANEGDAREYEGTPGFEEEDRVKDLTLDPTVFPNAAFLQDKNNLGRLKTTLANGDTDNDGNHDIIYSYGARSMSIWDADGNQVGDTGNDVEKMLFDLFPERWVDKRSDDKGPEPEALEIMVLNGTPYALLGLERTHGFMVFDISDPSNPVYMDYIFNANDEEPEGIDFVQMQAIPSAGMQAWGWLAVANEESDTTTFYRVSQVPEASTLALLGAGIGLLAVGRKRRRRDLAS